MKCPIGLGNCLECKHFDFDRNKCGYYKNIKKSSKKAFRKELRFRPRVKIDTDQREQELERIRFCKRYYDKKKYKKKYKPLKWG